MPRPTVKAQVLKKSKVPRKKIVRAKSLAMVKARAKKGIKRSGIEILVEKWLKEAGLAVKSQYRISRIHVDLALVDRERRVAIEVNGCFWHGCSHCNKVLSSTQLKWRRRDGRRYTFIHNARPKWELILVWEHDILGSPEETRQKLIEELKS